LVLLLLAGLAWIVPALWVHAYLYALVVWDAVLLAGCIADLVSLPDPARFRLTRIWAGPLSIGVPVEVRLRLENQSGQPLHFDLTEVLSFGRETLVERAHVAVPAQSYREIKFRMTPAERGEFRTGATYIRYRSALALAERWAQADLAQTLRVYPNLEHAREHAIYLARSRQIELQMRLMRLRGLGGEFESLRDYCERDEPRSICWTATARRGKLVAKTYQAERSQAVWALLDCGRLMRTRTGSVSKLDRAVDATLCLAQLAMHSGDRFGMLAYGREITQRVLPGRGPAHLRRILDGLAMAREEVPEADHIRAASTLLTLQRNRSMVLWITDLAETAMLPEVVEAAASLLPRHMVVFLVIGQPELRRKVASIPEHPVEMYEVAAAQEVVNRREALLGRLRERGAFALEAMPGQVSTAVLNQYLQIKERNLV
jgi:uncharacterized protein (DUF58 family)